MTIQSWTVINGGMLKVTETRSFSFDAPCDASPAAPRAHSRVGDEWRFSPGCCTILEYQPLPIPIERPAIRFVVHPEALLES